MDPFGLVVMIIASNFAARLEPHPSIHPSVRPSDMALVNLASARHMRQVRRAAVAAMAYGGGGLEPKLAAVEEDAYEMGIKKGQVRRDLSSGSVEFHDFLLRSLERSIFSLVWAVARPSLPSLAQRRHRRRPRSYAKMLEDRGNEQSCSSSNKCERSIKHECNKVCNLGHSPIIIQVSFLKPLSLLMAAHH